MLDAFLILANVAEREFSAAKTGKDRDMGAIVSAHAGFGEGSASKQRQNPSFSIEHCLLGRQPIRALFRALGIVVIGSFLVQSAVLPLRVGGNSMLPTYESREFLVTNRLAYLAQTPQFGDVVAIQTDQSNITILKRVLGVPGDEVRMVDGKVRVNGVCLEEPYAKVDRGWSMPAQNLGHNEYWVIGDNRSVSAFGKVHRDHIIGKVW